MAGTSLTGPGGWGWRGACGPRKGTGFLSHWLIFVKPRGDVQFGKVTGGRCWRGSSRRNWVAALPSERSARPSLPVWPGAEPWVADGGPGPLLYRALGSLWKSGGAGVRFWGSQARKTNLGDRDRSPRQILVRRIRGNGVVAPSLQRRLRDSSGFGGAGQLEPVP